MSSTPLVLPGGGDVANQTIMPMMHGRVPDGPTPRLNDGSLSHPRQAVSLHSEARRRPNNGGQNETKEHGH